MQIRTSQTVVKKTKKELFHGLSWENLDGRMELLGYLKVIPLIGINLVEFGRTKENQTRSHI